MNEAKRLAKKLLTEARDYERTGGFDHKTPKRNPGDGDDEMWSDHQLQRDLESKLLNLTLHPELEDQLNSAGSSLTGYSIMEELAWKRPRPFVEGEPIGAIPPGYARPQTYLRKKREKNGRMTVMAAMAITGTLRQRGLMELRHKNDLALARLLREPEVTQ